MTVRAPRFSKGLNSAVLLEKRIEYPVVVWSGVVRILEEKFNDVILTNLVGN